LQSKHNKLICARERIFYCCLQTAHNALMSDKEETLLSGPVCRWWRQIVYTPTELWVSVHVIASPSTHSSHPLDAARREATSSWLSRSGGLPLSISMIISGLHAVGWYSCPRSRDASNSQAQLHLDPPSSLMLSVGNTSFYSIATSTGGNSRQAQWFPCCKAFILTMRSTEPVDIGQMSGIDSILSAP